MAILSRFNWDKLLWANMRNGKPDTLLMWRERLSRSMFAFGAIVFPLSMIYILPVFIAEQRYGLIAVDAAFWLFMIYQLAVSRLSSRVNNYLALGALYALVMTFLVCLGPFHARPAWLVMCTVFAGLLFGVRGAVAASLFNLTTLMVLYAIMGSEDKGWASIYEGQTGTWILFAFNTSIISLATGLTAGFLLNRLDSSLSEQRHAADTLLKRSAELEKAYELLQTEMEQRNTAEKALIQSEAKYRLLAENASDIIWTLNLETRRFDYVSPSVLRLRGVTPDEAMEMSLEETLSPPSLELALKVMAEELERDGREGVHPNRSRTLEIQQACKDDSFVWAEATVTFIRNEEGRPVGVLGATRDIKERKKMEEALRKSRDELELRVRERTAELETYTRRLQESNQALQDFASIASHDMQEPLRKVISFGKLLKQGHADSLGEKGREFVDRMLNAADRMQTLLKALLDYSRVTTRAEPLRQVNFNDIVREVLYDLEVSIGKSEAEVHISELPMAEADPIQMRQLFQNLIGNAIKFHRPSEKPIVKVWGTTTDRGDVEIVVEDNGIGFDEKYLERILAPFQRLHGRSAYEGAGMGLAICKKIVDRHNGRITARSVPGRGSVFTVRLPSRQRV